MNIIRVRIVSIINMHNDDNFQMIGETHTKKKKWMHVDTLTDACITCVCMVVFA